LLGFIPEQQTLRFAHHTALNTPADEVYSRNVAFYRHLKLGTVFEDPLMDRKTLLVHVTVQEREIFRLAYIVTHPHQQFHVMRGFPYLPPPLLRNREGDSTGIHVRSDMVFSTGQERTDATGATILP
jgi:hypothetical protein